MPFGNCRTVYPGFEDKRAAGCPCELGSAAPARFPQLDNQAPLRAVEIDSVRTPRMLPEEFEALNLMPRSKRHAACSDSVDA